MSVSKMCASGVSYDIQGESKKMSISEKGSLITNGHFFLTHPVVVLVFMTSIVSW